MAGGPSHLETFDYKPKLAELNGQPMPESFTKGQPIAQLQGQAEVLRPAVRLPEVRPVRAGDLRTVSPDRHGGRRTVHHPLAEDRGHQSRPGPHLHEHGPPDLRPALDGLLDLVRPGRRDARICRGSSCWSRRAGPASSSRSRRGSGTADSCPAGSRACSSGRRATRCCTCPSRPACQRQPAADVVQAVNR